MMRDEVHICSDGTALAQHACDWLVERIGERLAEPGSHFVLSLSGGSTPKQLYELLSQLPSDRIEWQRVILIWGDERNVPSDDPASNFRMVKESLIDRVPIPDENVLPVPSRGEAPDMAAQGYEDLLRRRLAIQGETGFPAIDCVLLGLGDDVHTASLFPHTAALNETKRWVVENCVPQLDTWRITLTAPLINAASCVAFLISGVGKQSALDKLWHAAADVARFPAQLIRPRGQLLYLVDQAAIAGTVIPERFHSQNCV